MSRRHTSAVSLPDPGPALAIALGLALALPLLFSMTAAAAGSPGASAPSGAASPTTTYVPSGGTAVPGTTSGTTTATVPATSPTTSAPGAAGGAATSRAGASAPGKGLAGARGGRGHTGRSISTAEIVIAALAALLVLACAGWALARRRAFEPHWWLSLRHALAEAGFRASETWAEFTDWIRLGH